jgi:monoamine oxidase
VAEGSATVALRMAEELGDRLRLGCVVEAIDVAPSGCEVGLRGGERLGAEAVVCALPVGPLRDVTVSGVSAERLDSLHRQRSALAVKTVAAYPASFWSVGGATTEGIWASVWIQRDGILSALTPPDRLGPFLATPPDRRREEFLATLAALMGEEALHPLLHAERLWGIDPFTQGYVTAWRPGDVMAVGPLHGTHEPPFYVCGSDQWVAGYMEGAVRTGRDAASQALGLGPREFAAVG